MLNISRSIDKHKFPFIESSKLLQCWKKISNHCEKSTIAFKIGIRDFFLTACTCYAPVKKLYINELIYFHSEKTNIYHVEALIFNRITFIPHSLSLIVLLVFTHLICE